MKSIEIFCDSTFNVIFGVINKTKNENTIMLSYGSHTIIAEADLDFGRQYGS